MGSFDFIRRWVLILVAEVLGVSASVAELLLRGQPRWLAQLRLLEEDLRQRARPPGPAEPAKPAGAAGTHGARAEGEGPAAAGREFLDAYAILNRALRDLEARGLALDEDFVDRMRREWSPESIVNYLHACEDQLRTRVAEALDEAADALGAAGALETPPGRETAAAPRRRAAS